MKKTTIIYILLALATMLALHGCSQQAGTAEALKAVSVEGPRSGADSGSGTLILSVNPEISVSYNKEGLVTKVEGLNDDGTAIVKGYDDYVGKDCREVVKELVRKIDAAGYFVSGVEGEGREITIQIEPGSVLPEDDFLETIARDVRSTVGEINVAAGVSGAAQGDDGYNDTGYGPDSDGVTDYNDTDYGPNSDGATDYDDAKPAARPAQPANTPAARAAATPKPANKPAKAAKPKQSASPAKKGDTGYGDTDYGSNSDGVTDYNDTDYGTNSDGVTDYGDTNYGDTGYGDTNYGGSSAPSYSVSGGSGYGNTGYGDSGNSGYGNS